MTVRDREMDVYRRYSRYGIMAGLGSNNNKQKELILINQSINACFPARFDGRDSISIGGFPATTFHYGLMDAR